MRAPIEARRVVVNALSVDVEDYFQVWALAPWFPRSKWDETPCRIERNLDLILELLEEADTRATFFTLGWIAERYPKAIRRVAAAGHEIASHGYAHQRVDDLEREAFHADIHLAKTILEDLAGVEVKGYRAPSFSISDETEWAHDCIAKAGYRYSSSVYPIKHDHYGLPHAPRFAYRSRPALLEVPITTTRFLDRNWPAGGGGYFRLLPYSVSKWSIRRVNEAEEQPAVFYFHPWELDPGQPRVKGPGLKTRVRHYLNLERSERRLRRLLKDFRWDRVDRVFLGGDA
jgi:polysaccharide deacetylase family protein (PEP-CTERM system associated)